MRSILLLTAAASLSGQVTFDQIRTGAAADWLTYQGSPQGHRHSSLKQIDRSNAARLQPLWVYQIDKTDKFETSPIVSNGIMYISEPPSDVTAIDTRTGRALWRYRRVLPH